MPFLLIVIEVWLIGLKCQVLDPYFWPGIVLDADLAPSIGLANKLGVWSHNISALQQPAIQLGVWVNNMVNTLNDKLQVRTRTSSISWHPISVYYHAEDIQFQYKVTDILEDIQYCRM